MGRRFLAYLADCFILVLYAFILAGWMALRGRDPNNESAHALGRLALILWLIYMVAAPYFTGMTLGRYLLGVEIRSSRPGHAHPALWELGMRETAFRWMSCILFIGYIPAFFDARPR